jgi:hypothetical protein
MLLLISAVAAAAIAATANLVHRDGYRRIPTVHSSSRD